MKYSAQSTLLVAAMVFMAGAAPATPAPATRAAATQPDEPLHPALAALAEKFSIVFVSSATLPPDFKLQALPADARDVTAALDEALRPRTLKAVDIPGAPFRVVEIAPSVDNPGHIPVSAGIDAAAIEPSDRQITHVIPVRGVLAKDPRTDLAPLIAAGARVSVDERTNSLTVTDTAARIHRLVEIFAAVDYEPVPVSRLEKMRLKNAKAEVVADILNKKYAHLPPAPPQRPPVVTRLYAGFDVNTNTLVITGPPDAVAHALADAEQLDAPPAP